MHVGGIFCDLAQDFYCIHHAAFVSWITFLWNSQSIRRLVQVPFPISLIEDSKSKKIHLTQLKIFFPNWGTLKHGVPQGPILWPLLFIIYINVLPLRINSASEPILLFYDTTVIIPSRNFKDFCSASNQYSLIWLYGLLLII